MYLHKLNSSWIQIRSRNDFFAKLPNLRLEFFGLLDVGITAASYHQSQIIKSSITQKRIRGGLYYYWISLLKLVLGSMSSQSQSSLPRINTSFLPILLKGHERSITTVKYNQDGDLIFTASKDRNPTCWYADTGERLGT